MIPSTRSRRRAEGILRAMRKTTTTPNGWMRRALTLTLTLAALVVVALLAGGASAGSEVVELNDQNFEHLTQASTGATTGDWFVKFFAPWCGHCVRMAPTWDEVALELKGEVNLAKVDVTKNPGCGARFGIRAFPMLKFFHQGQVYDYRGPRDAEHLLAFARGGFKEVAGVPVPPPPTFLDVVKGQVKEATEMLQALYVQVAREATLVFKGEKPVDAPFVVMIAMILVFFGLVVLTFAALFTGPKGEATAAGKDKKNK